MLQFKLYQITDRKLCKKPFLEVIESACKAGVKAIQLREKDLNSRELLELAQKVRKITSNYKTKLFINDRADIARLVNADGLQIPENGLPIKVAKRLLSKKLIGGSCHSLEKALKAEKEGADFIVFGSVFKGKFLHEPQGLEKLQLVCKKIKIPVFAVGGVNFENAGLCISAGAYGVAAISAIMASEDVEGEVKKFGFNKKY